MKLLSLGGLALRSLNILSPLEGVSCVGFRKLCFINGAGLTFTEMVRSQGILKNNMATLDLIDTYDADTPTGLQLLSKSAVELEATLKKIEALSEESKWNHFKNICAIDINLGCPSPEVIREGAGPALLKRKKHLTDMFTVLANWKTTQQSLPNIKAVGCKIRLGLNPTEQGHKVYLSVAQIAATVGLDWITVHARNAKQKSSDLPTWSAIGEVVSTVKEISSSTKVIGNGNVTNQKAASEMFQISGCDGFMVARAAIRNPWIFENLNSNVTITNAERWPTPEQVAQAMECYQEISSKHNTKAKYLKFHEENFKRLLNAAKTGDFSQPYRAPKTIHL